MNKQTQFVHDLIINNPKINTILNIGYRYDSDQTILNACIANNKAFEVMEIYKPNCDVLKNNLKIKEIYNMDVKEIKSLAKKFDAIIWLHGPEHVKWEDFLNFRKDIEDAANHLVIYQAPEGFYPQEDIYGNIYEKHVQTLSQKMFKDLGYETNNFIEFGERTFSAFILK
jgi:hypothetical protein